MFRNNECDPNDLPSKYIPNDGSLEAFMIPKTPEPSEGTSSNQVSNGNSFDALAAMLQNDQHKMQDHAAISSRSHSGQNGDPIVIQDDQHQTNGDATPSPYNQSIYFLPTQTPQKMRHDLAHNNFTVYGSQVPPPKHAFAPQNDRAAVFPFDSYIMRDISALYPQTPTHATPHNQPTMYQTPPSQQTYDATTWPMNDSPMQPLQPSQLSQPPQHPQYPRQLQHSQHVQSAQHPQPLPYLPQHLRYPPPDQRPQYSPHPQPYNSQHGQPPGSSSLDPDLDMPALKATLKAVEDKIKIQQAHHTTLHLHMGGCWALFEIDRMRVIQGQREHELTSMFEDHVESLERVKRDLRASEDVLQLLQFERWRLNEKIRDLEAADKTLKTFNELVANGQIMG